MKVLNPPKIENLKPQVRMKLLRDLLLHKQEIIRPTTDKDEYIHWDKLRHLRPPLGLTSEQWWCVIKFARQSLYKVLPFMDKYGAPFVIATPDVVLRKLHSIDRNMGNSIIQNQGTVFNSQMRETYLIQSLIEEAINSSQLEGAATTRKVAKEMLQTNRKPRDVGECMIFNNYQAMQYIHQIKNEELTVDRILQLHSIVTRDTLPDHEAGDFRTAKDDIRVWDRQGRNVLHVPPLAEELKDRMQRICQFANTKEEQEKFFIHPLIKAIILHFMLAYDHPFVDGNGRTARALFYWAMARQGYWLIEYVSISNILKKSPSDYDRSYLYTETDENDLTYFVIHQLEVIQEAIKSLYRYLDRKMQETKETEWLLQSNQKLRNKSLNYRQIELLRHAMKHPNVQYLIEGYRQSHNVTYDTARTDLLKVVKLKLLHKKKVGKAYVFVAPNDLKNRIENVG